MASKVDLYLSRISHLSQFVLVAFAIFGYFYTVRPIYQKELLSEDIAKKEVELKSLKNDLSNSREQLQKKQESQSRLLSDIAALKRQYTISEQELDSINKELTASKNELEKQKKLAKKAINDNYKNLESVFWENFDGLVSRTYITESYRRANFAGDGTESYENYKELYVTPYTAINNAIRMGGHNFFENAENIPSSLRDKLLDKVAIALNKNKEILSKYPDGFELTINGYKKKIDAYKSSKIINEHREAYEAETSLLSYVSTQQKKSMSIAKDFLNSVKYSN